MFTRPRILTAAFIGVVLPAAACATKPAFDCAKASGEVEMLICKDAALAALDRQLDAVYTQALAKAKGALVQTLRTEQRSWVAGRNDCWKAQTTTWITATWTVDTVPSCVEAQYHLRISELQAVWQLMPPETRTYVCANQPAHEIVANFFDTQPPTIRLEHGDHTATMWLVGSPREGRYEGQNVDLVHQSDALTVNWLMTGETLQCEAR